MGALQMRPGRWTAGSKGGADRTFRSAWVDWRSRLAEFAHYSSSVTHKERADKRAQGNGFRKTLLDEVKPCGVAGWLYS